MTCFNRGTWECNFGTHLCKYKGPEKTILLHKLNVRMGKKEKKSKKDLSKTRYNS